MSSTAHISFDNNGNVLGKYGVGIRSNDNNNDNNDDVNIKVDKRKRNIHIPR